jgi:hypothetical protein
MLLLAYVMEDLSTVFYNLKLQLTTVKYLTLTSLVSERFCSSILEIFFPLFYKLTEKSLIS